MNTKRICAVLGLLLAPLMVQAQQGDWLAITGADALREFVSDRTFTWTEGRGESAITDEFP